MVIVLMGVSGAGKTTVGKCLAAELGWPFLDGDDLHSEAGRAQMRRGEPLTDADRAPWLARVRRLIESLLEGGESAIVACSALRETYRAEIVADPAQVKFVYLRGSYETVAARLARRRGHFMPPGLLRSQFETLEEPRGALTVGIEAPPDEIAAEIRRRLGIGGVRTDDNRARLCLKYAKYRRQDRRAGKESATSREGGSQLLQSLQSRLRAGRGRRAGRARRRSGFQW